MIRITYRNRLTELQDEVLEKFHAMAKEQGIELEEYDLSYEDSGLPPPVKRPKK